MALFSETALQNSSVIGVLNPLVESIQKATTRSQILNWAGLRPDLDDSSTLSDDGQGSPVESDAESSGEEEPSRGADPGPTSAYVRSSTLYPVIPGVQAFLRSSWLYQWLTAEPEPEVIVIDLRETWTAGPIIDLLDRVLTGAERELLPAVPTATATRFGYWLNNQFTARPIRAVSVLLAIVVNLGLLAELSGGTDAVSATTFFLLALLLLCIRGFRSTMSWAELSAKLWFQRSKDVLVAIFEPPEPPESDRRVQDQASPEEVSDQSAEPSEEPSTDGTDE